MKKLMIMSAVLLVLSTSFALTGCGNTSSSTSGESTISDSKSETTSESTGVSKAETAAYNCPGTGFSFVLPESVKLTNGFLVMHDEGDVDYDSGVMNGWPVYFDVSEEKYNSITEADAGKFHSGFSFQIMCVKDVNTEEEAKDKILALVKKIKGEDGEEDRASCSKFKMIHKENGYIWLASTNERSDNIREDCKDEYNAFYDATDEIISNMKFYTPQVWHGAEEGTSVSFETVNLDGNPVNSKALFAQNKVTMINIWATSCGPCIQELPELEAMDKEFEKKGGAIIGLLDDVWVSNMKYLDEAQSIIKENGVTYPNLCAWEGYNDVLSHVGTPTTYFVDSQGRILGDPILGANPKKYRERMEEYLSQAE